MTRQELELKAKEFDSKLKRHPMSSEELQKVLCDFVEALRIHDVVGRGEQLLAVAKYVYNHFDDSSSKKAKDYLDDYLSQ
jgi:hypothetical protein